VCTLHGLLLLRPCSALLMRALPTFRACIHQQHPPLTRARRVDAGKVELDGSSYLGLSLPFTITQLIWIEALLMGAIEVYRNNELDPVRRLYPGGWWVFVCVERLLGTGSVRSSMPQARGGWRACTHM